VGRLGLVDHDVVDTSNLHRQIIHNELRLGMHKATSAAMSCAALNSGVQLEPHLQGLSAANAVQLVQQYDLVVDASDNPPTRYLISDACAATGRPLVSAAAVRNAPRRAGRASWPARRSRRRGCWGRVAALRAGSNAGAAAGPQVGTDGQLTVYCHGEDGPCYRWGAAAGRAAPQRTTPRTGAAMPQPAGDQAPARPAAPARCLFPESPAPENCSRCADAGVLGVVPGGSSSLSPS
jgi:adenylyltransferase/sulfurtransferase